jgi:hypothetical protein
MIIRTGTPATEALRPRWSIRSRVTDLLGVTDGTFAQEVRLTHLRDHVVKCFLDDPDDKDAFTVEVMPALRRPGCGLRIPERSNEAGWVTADPEFLLSEVAARHGEWRFFAAMVRAIKKWKDVANIDMKSLTAEVLTLNCMPAPEPGQVLSRQAALQRFFTAAASAVMDGVMDPAGLCGEIQPGRTAWPRGPPCWRPRMSPRGRSRPRSAVTMTPRCACGGRCSGRISRNPPAEAWRATAMRLGNPVMTRRIRSSHPFRSTPRRAGHAALPAPAIRHYCLRSPAGAPLSAQASFAPPAGGRDRFGDPA